MCGSFSFLAAMMRRTSKLRFYSAPRPSHARRFEASSATARETQGGNQPTFSRGTRARSLPPMMRESHQRATPLHFPAASRFSTAPWSPALLARVSSPRSPPGLLQHGSDDRAPQRQALEMRRPTSLPLNTSIVRPALAASSIDRGANIGCHIAAWQPSP